MIVFRASASRHVEHWRTDGLAQYWVEAYGDANPKNFDQPYAEVWAAPYTNDPAVLASTAKKLAQVDGVRAAEVAFGGYFAVADRTSRVVHVVRWPDGAKQTLSIPALYGKGPFGQDPYMTDVVFVSKTELSGVLQEVPSGFAFVKLQLAPWP